jgi:hypothetical protein
VQPRAAQNAHQHRLCLVISVVPQRDAVIAARFSEVLQELVADLASALLLRFSAGS